MNKQKLQATNKFFIGCPHFNHEKIIGYTNRPFTSKEHAMEVMREKWNAKVPKGGLVYCVGDFFITGFSDKCAKEFEDFIDTLNGTKILVIGNHDVKSIVKSKKWAKTDKIINVCIDGQKIVLCHYPMRTWQWKAHGSWQIYAHTHLHIDEELGIKPYELQESCTVEYSDYAPVSFEEMRARMSKRIKAREELGTTAKNCP